MSPRSVFHQGAIASPLRAFGRPTKLHHTHTAYRRWNRFLLHAFSRPAKSLCILRCLPTRKFLTHCICHTRTPHHTSRRSPICVVHDKDNSFRNATVPNCYLHTPCPWNMPFRKFPLYSKSKALKVPKPHMTPFLNPPDQTSPDIQVRMPLPSGSPSTNGPS